MTNHTLSSQHNVSVMEIQKCHKNLCREAHMPLDILPIFLRNMPGNYDPRSSCEPRQDMVQWRRIRSAQADFDPRGSCEPRRLCIKCYQSAGKFRSTRLLRASTGAAAWGFGRFSDFDPRGSCEPRLVQTRVLKLVPSFRSTRLLRASTVPDKYQRSYWIDFDPRGSCEPRPGPAYIHTEYYGISIHEALASLDQNICCRD